MSSKNFSAIGGDKIHHTKTVYAGISFDSKQEAFHYSQLILLQKAGEIRNLITHPRFPLQDSFKSDFQKNKIRAINYVADFMYEDRYGKIHVEDVKGEGMITQVAKVKIKLFLCKYPQYAFEVVCYASAKRNGIYQYRRVPYKPKF